MCVTDRRILNMIVINNNNNNNNNNKATVLKNSVIDQQ
jgi:hypothetical protein